MSASIEQLEKLIGYSFRNIQLLERALTHRSFSGEHSYAEDNERLEFLGDAVLELIVSEILMSRYEDYAEGRLTKLRAQLVSADNLSEEAKRFDLGNYLRLGKAETNSGGRTKKALLADTLEALIAAVYLDSDLDTTRALVTRLLTSPERLAQADATLAEQNPKSTLQEFLQAHKLPAATYQVVEETGPPHDLTFLVTLTVDDLCQTSGTGNSKKTAEQMAAARALSDPAVARILQETAGSA